MGSSASKAARKLPKRVESPKWAGKRTPGPSTGTTGEQVDETLASEHRSKGALVDVSFIVPTWQKSWFVYVYSVIEKDAQDPHLLANLRQLGPVNVDHHMKSFRHVRPSWNLSNVVSVAAHQNLCFYIQEPVASNTARLFQARSDHANDLEATRQNRGPTTSNTQFYASQLTSALNARKEAAHVGVVKSVTQELGIDFEKVESLARFVNTPSVSTGNVRRRVNESGHEQVTAKVRRKIIWWACSEVTDSLTGCLDRFPICTSEHHNQSADSFYWLAGWE